jgi:hypothetical protein
MTVSWRYQALTVPYGEKDSHNVLQKALAAFPRYWNLIGVTDNGTAWVLVVEDEAAP